MLEKNFFQYLTYSDDDVKWELVCTDIGANEIKPFEAYPPNRDKHPNSFKNVCSGRTLHEYQIIFITKGEGHFTSLGKTHRITPGSILLLFPGVEHSYQPDFPIGWNEYWVGFMGKYPDTLLQNGVISPEHPVYHPGLQDTILASYTDIFERVKLQRPGYQMRIGASIMMLLADTLACSLQNSQHSQAENIIEKTKFICEEHIFETIDLQYLAAKLDISSSHLNNLFKSYTGMTPYQYFLHLKINKAKELLEMGELSVKEIAFTLSFESQYYFSRLFKKKTGLPPSNWSNFQQ